MPTQILLLTRDEDVAARHLARLLRARGVGVQVFDPASYPIKAKLTLELSADGLARSVVLPDTVIDLGSVNAVWVGMPGAPVPHPTADGAIREYVQKECSAFSADLWATLDCPAVPATQLVLTQAGHKAYQLVQASRVGLLVPATLVTTDPDAFLRFYCEHDGHLITKVGEQLGAYGLTDDFIRFTERVVTRDLTAVDQVRLCPVIVQPYVEKAVELRVTVVGRQLFAAEISSQESNHARVDWRRYDLRTTPHRPHSLPSEVTQRCLLLMDRLGLSFGAIDLILTPDGRYVFLEVNPTGQFWWIEHATGLPISAALCDLLLSVAERPPSVRPAAWPAADAPRGGPSERSGQGRSTQLVGEE